jgi:ABC-type multidrug transport system permease subunit
MKNILLIGHNDIRLFLKDKVNYFWLIVVPVLFCFFMGFANRGPGSPSSPRPGVLLENQDEGFLGELLMQELIAQGLNVLGPDQANNAERGLRIPSNFTKAVQEREQVKVEFFKTKNSSLESAAMIELRLVRALIAVNAALIQRAIEADGGEVFDAEALKAALEQPNPVQVAVSFAGRRPVPAGFNQSLPGILVMFLMLNLLIFGGASLASERQTGVLKRLVVHPLKRQELVLGKIYGRFLLGLVQALFMLLFGQLVLNVPVFREPVGMVLIVAVYAWVCASFGVLIGATARNPDKIIGLCIMAALLMSALGGCWWPIEIVPDTFKIVAHLVPTGWAMDGFHRLISFGGTSAEIGTELGVLAGFAIVGSIIAGKLLRY